MQATELRVANFARNLLKGLNIWIKNLKNIEEFNDVISVLTPYSNTGSMDTRETSLRALIDWVSVTFRACKNWHEIVRLLGLKTDDFTVEEKRVPRI